MTRLLLLRVKDVFDPDEQFKEIEVGDNLDDYYTHLGCDCFDIATRKIGNKYYDVFCDDCGLFADNPIVSMIDEEGRPMLVGNLIFANHDQEGNTVSLTDEDVHNIMKNSYIGTGDGRVLFMVLGSY